MPREVPLPAARPVLTVDLRALVRNAETLGKAAGPAALAPVVKADAYGLGAEGVCRALARAGVRDFFVAYPHEAEAVREGVNRPGIGPVRVYVLNGFHEEDAARFDLLSLRPVLADEAQMTGWAARGGPCALGVDLGMNRLGLRPDRMLGALERSGLDPDDVRMVVAHLSHASEPASPRNAQQADAFEVVSAALRPRLPRARFSLSASGGLWLPSEPEEGVVRPGIALYGASPTDDPDDALDVVATLTAPVIALRDVPAGETVSYGGRWRADRDSRIAVLSIGYADGYGRSLSGRGTALLGGTPCPVVGTVTMDLTMLDVTEAGPVRIGQHAELFGGAISVDRIARLAGTIGYDLLAGVGPRVVRRYHS